MEIQKKPSISSPQSQVSFDRLGQSLDRQEKDQKESGLGELPKQKVEEKIKGINNLMMENNVELKFQLHDKSGEYYVQMINSKTGEVFREIPSKKILDYFSDLKNNLSGLLYDKRI